MTECRVKQEAMMPMRIRRKPTNSRMVWNLLIEVVGASSMKIPYRLVVEERSSLGQVDFRFDAGSAILNAAMRALKGIGINSRGGLEWPAGHHRRGADVMGW